MEAKSSRTTSLVARRLTFERINIPLNKQFNFKTETRGEYIVEKSVLLGLVSALNHNDGF
jgi:hypothetical protein